ncbi:MAG: hypothetical protein MJZ89_06420 [Paludibacteraceae bacterium]|nr:hypothetical protein [Paludibacteraceae bacterium]
MRACATTVSGGMVAHTNTPTTPPVRQQRAGRFSDNRAAISADERFGPISIYHSHHAE